MNNLMGAAIQDAVASAISQMDRGELYSLVTGAYMEIRAEMQTNQMAA